MNREDIIRAILSERAALEAEGVTHVAIYGSRARGDERAKSDLDVLIDVDPDAGFSLLNLSGVGLIIENATGIETGIAMRRSLAVDFADRISNDLISVF